MKTFNHKSRTRERMVVPSGPSTRQQRRAKARREARAERKAEMRERIEANPRLVRA